MPSCDICSREYKRPEHLKRHVETAHPWALREADVANHSIPASPRKFYCDWEGCEAIFNRNDVLLRHKRSHCRPGGSARLASARYTSNGARSSKRSRSDSGPFVEASESSNTGANGMMGQTFQASHSGAQHTPLDMPNAPHQSAAFAPTSSSSMPIQQSSYPFDQPTAADAMASIGPPSLEQSSAQAQDVFASMILDSQVLQSSEFMYSSGLGGWNFGQSLGGLDWIFDDLTDATSTTHDHPSVTKSDGTAYDPSASQWQATSHDPSTFNRFNDVLGNPDEGGPNPTETMNLLNLATTALGGSHPAAIPSSTRMKPAEEEGADADAWPQDFRPINKKPEVVELSDFCLEFDSAGELGDFARDLMSVSNAAAARQNRRREVPLVLIDESGNPTREPSRRASLQRDSDLKWPITEALRQQLLSYLQHSCQHPWSIYSFKRVPPAFLTSRQMEILVSLFFRKFHPYVPVLHPSTFDPAVCPPVLLLILLAIGLTFYATEMESRSSSIQNPMGKTSVNTLRRNASMLSLAFSELARIGVMSAFEADQRGFQNISINQAWVLQQMFGIGSGDKRLYKLAERNRGGMVTAIRRLGLLCTKSLHVDAAALKEAGAEQLKSTWAAWTERESRIRLGWFVFVYDQMFSFYLDISPMLLYTELTSPFPCDESLWNADEPEEWRRQFLQRVAKKQPSPAQEGITLTSSPRLSKVHFLTCLKQLLYPQLDADRPLRLNRLDAYILAVTLYRVRWDLSKQSILFGDADGLEDEVFGDSGANLVSTAASRALQGLAEAASHATVTFHHQLQQSQSPNSISLALGIDVQLLRLLSDLHFSGPPTLFEKLRDAAGRTGMLSARRHDAISWLKNWMQRPSHLVNVRQILLASARVFDLIRSSLASTASHSDILVLQSNICIISLFHAALAMWACSKFATVLTVEGDDLTFSYENHRDSPYSASRAASSLPTLDPTVIAAVEEAGILDLVSSHAVDDHHMHTQHPHAEPWAREGSSTNATNWGQEPNAEHARLVDAWVKGGYISSRDGRVRTWREASSLVVNVSGIGPISLSRGREPLFSRSRSRTASAPSSGSPSSNGQDQGQHVHGKEGRPIKIDEDVSSTFTSAQVHPTTLTPSTSTAASQMQPQPTSEAPSQIRVSSTLVLRRFATLLKRLDWGLASSFQRILEHMGRWEEKNKGSSITGGGGLSVR